MMKGYVKDDAAYSRVVQALKRAKRGVSPSGLTPADISARTGLPLPQVRELVPRAADEYRGRLEVTESGEILYSFPRGFTSRYRGLIPGLKRFFGASGRFLRAAGALLFKVWIMVMLVGYFALFVLIVLAALALSVSASFSSSSRDGRSRRTSGGFGGFYLATRVIDIFIRLWFYSQLAGAVTGENYRGNYPRQKPQGPKRFLHKAIFSFVFGDGDPNGDWDSREKKAFIAWVQAHRGVISFPRLMALYGLPPDKADEEITRLCAEFGGYPEATEEGTVVYRFDDLLKRADRADKSFSAESAPLRQLKPFSSNPGKANVWFAVINGVNLLFGSYFFFNALRLGPLVIQDGYLAPGRAGEAVPYIYHFVNALGFHLGVNPYGAVLVGLGAVPLVFSLFFWLIPLVRKYREGKKNEAVKLENFRRLSFGKILDNPLAVRPGDFNYSLAECSPKNHAAACDRVIKEMGSYAVPEVTVGAEGELYSFGELAREEEALEKYRAGLKTGDSGLGETVFDSDARV